MLYRKYRPKLFSDVVGQEHVVTTLKGALTSGRVGHAYLFTGPRGTGKTSIARIFAKALNCIARQYDGNPDDLCESCIAFNMGNSLDLVEIDAASNRGIDEIRNLKESAMISAPSGRHKVFIIDEVHMLTKDAFNALLKILEEPPTKLMFVLATTEPHKILPTVLSRVQRFDFRRLENNQILKKLKSVVQHEKIKIEDEALTTIALASDGALRDAEVSLSKVIASDNGKEIITVEDVEKSLGLIPFRYYPEFFLSLISNNKTEAIELIRRLHEDGFDLDGFAKGVLSYLRKLLIAQVSPDILARSEGSEVAANLVAQAKEIESKKLIEWIKTFTKVKNEIKFSPIQQLPLELAVIELS